jgi:hypothetical protein
MQKMKNDIADFETNLKQANDNLQKKQVQMQRDEEILRKNVDENKKLKM